MNNETSETCPGCGAKVREGYSNYRRFDCMALEFDADGPIKYEFRADKECLSRQIAQRDERNAALEARIKELEGDRDSYRCHRGATHDPYDLSRGNRAQVVTDGMVGKWRRR